MKQKENTRKKMPEQNKPTIQIKCQGADALPIDLLVPFQGNLKKLTKKNAEKLSKQITKRFIDPIKVWQHEGFYKILNGHQRLKSLLFLRESGYDIPLLPVDYIHADSEEEARENVLMLDSQYGEFDDAELKDWLEKLDAQDRDLLRLVDTEIQLPREAEETQGDDDVSEDIETITKQGDLWELGEHRVLCGDSTKSEDVDRLMAGEKADMVFTDPPYGINIQSVKGKVGGTAITNFQTAAIDGGHIVKSKQYKIMKGDNSIEISKKFYKLCVNKEYRNIILWGGNYFSSFLPPSSSWIIWDKEMIGNFSQAEMAWTSFKKGGVRIYKYLWNGLSREGNRTDELKARIHETQKPVGLFVNIFDKLDNMKIIFDGFLGSGSSLIACEKIGRRCFGIEIESHYCDVIANRYRQWCINNNRTPIMKLNGEIFDGFSQK